MHHDGAAAERPHGVAENVPCSSLNDVLHELGAVGIQPFPLLCGADALIGDTFAAELVAPDAPELRPVLPHLVGEGTLGPTEGLGDGAVGDLVVVHPHGDDGVRVGVKFPQAGEEAVKQVAVCNDALNGRSLRRNHVQQSVLAIFTDGNVQRGQVVGTTVLAGEAVSITGPDLTLGTDAVSVSLLPHTDAGGLPVVFVTDFFSDRDFLAGSADVDERLAFFCIAFHKNRLLWMRNPQEPIFCP